MRLWPTAIPQYNKGHLDILKDIEAGQAKLPGLFLGGNYRTGVAFGDCVAYGMDEAARIADYLTSVEKKEEVKKPKAAAPSDVVVKKEEGIVTTVGAAKNDTEAVGAAAPLASSSNQ